LESLDWKMRDERSGKWEAGSLKLEVGSQPITENRQQTKRRRDERSWKREVGSGKSTENRQLTIENRQKDFEMRDGSKKTHNS
jgi:hypothetical protein